MLTKKMGMAQAEDTEHLWSRVWDPRIPRVFTPQEPVMEYLRDSAKASPDKPALIYYGRCITYRQLSEAIDRFAGVLAGLDVMKGDRVALFMQNCPQFVISYFGALRAGAVVVSLNPMFKSAELEYELNDSGAGTIVALDYLYPEVLRAGGRIRLKNVILTRLADYLPEAPELPLPAEMEQPEHSFPGTLDFLELLRRSRSPSAPVVTSLKNDVALLQYTGGTTGLPKGAVLTHYTLAHNAAAVPLWFAYSGQDVHTGIMPFFHVAGMIHSMCAALVSGGTLVVLARFSPEVLAKAIEKYRCTVLNTITTMYTGLLEWTGTDRYDLSSLRLVWEGGAPLPAAAEERLKKLLPQAFVGEGYGLTETLTGGVNTPLYRRKQGFIGIPFPSTDIKIVDLETGRKECGVGEEGEVVIRGPCVMRGYWNNPAETRQQIRKGWLHTGDIGRFDEEGYLAIVSRKKELIKCSGFSVFPSEVEDLLYKHPAIAEVSVIGIPDSYRGETPKAFIVLRPEYRGKIREGDILTWAKDTMAPYKRPRVVEFREALPKSGAGKVLRRVLAEEEAARNIERK
jgi:acyl-CoA synthetase (AMP-forming)/AMP-acid ligase II